MSYNFKKPGTETYGLGRGDGMVMIEGSSFFANMGDIDSLKLKPDFETIERFSKQYGQKTSVRKDIIKRGGTLEFTLLQRTPEVRQIIYQGLSKAIDQAAIAQAVDMQFAKVAVDGVISLGKRDVTVTAVTVDGQPLQADKYRVDRRNGLVQVYASGDVVVSFTAKATDASRTKIGGYSTNGLNGAFLFRGVNSIGIPELVNVWKVQFQITGDTDLIGGDDYDQLQVTGTMFPDTDQDDEDDQLFTVEQIPDGDPA